MGGKETYICLLDKGLVATLQVEPEALKRFEGFLCVQLRGTEYLNAEQYSHLLNWLEDALSEVARDSDMRVWCITAVAKDYRWCQTLACYPDGSSECKMVQASCLLGK